MVIVIAPKPKPDFYLVDKLIIYCIYAKIKPILCVNKSDILTDKLKSLITEQYDNVCDIVYTSTKDNNGIEILLKILKGKISVLAGQSAVGKSSLTNVLIPTASQEIGELSKKIERGKNCTRVSELHIIDKNTFLTDTPGFSSFELSFLQSNELYSFYPDFNKYRSECKYNTCKHIGESIDLCGIKKIVKSGKLVARYNRYVEIYNKMKVMEDKKYG